MKNGTTIIWVLLLLGIAGLAIYFLTRKGSSTVTNNTDTASATSTAISANNSLFNAWSSNRQPWETPEQWIARRNAEGWKL